MSGRCEACLGSGLVSSETGNPLQNSEGWRADAIQCAYCDGYGALNASDPRSEEPDGLEIE